MFERITKMVSVIFLLFPNHIQHKIPPVTPIHEKKLKINTTVTEVSIGAIQSDIIISGNGIVMSLVG